jgi:hypothetical protein
MTGPNTERAILTDRMRRVKIRLRRRMKMTPARFGLRIGLIATGLAVALGLAGCLQPTRAPSTPRADSTSSASPSTTTEPSRTAAPSTRAFVENCGTLITPDQLYAYNPNYVVDPGYAPKSGTLAAAVKSQLGQTCGWINESSGSVLEVAIATPTPAKLAAARTAAAGGTKISTNGENGYFGVDGGIGSAQIFMGSLWLVVSSPDFATPGDAAQLYPVVVRNQMKAGG